MANIKLSKLIKKINEEHKPPSGWRASDKIPSAQAGKREGGPASEQAADKLHAENSARFVESAQAQLGRKPKKIL